MLRREDSEWRGSLVLSATPLALATIALPHLSYNYRIKCGYLAGGA
jgi:hypothetical protein